MKRTTVAFLVAGLWGPAALGLDLQFVSGIDLDATVMIEILAIGGAISYGLMLALGLPLYRRFGGRGRFWRVLAIGAAAGFLVVTSSFAAAITLVMADGEWRGFGKVGIALPIAFALPTALGSLIGATWWVIARPNRLGSPVQHF